jgi:hypothetical protein
MKTLPVLARLAFAVGVIPLLGMTFFSPGLQTERLAGVGVLAFGIATFLLLVASARRHRPDRLLVLLQLLLLGLVLYESLSDARLYMGS